MTDTTLDPFLGRLRTHSALDEDVADAILALPYRLKEAPAGKYLIREDDLVSDTGILLQGFACSRKAVGGGRQIIALHYAGDALNLGSFALETAEHGVQTLARSLVAELNTTALLDLSARMPALALALWRDTLKDASIRAEWLANNSRRDAFTRVAHFFCEVATRQNAIDQGSDGVFELAMTQEQIADTLGLTAVHVNRMLKVLRSEGLIKYSGNALSIPDRARLHAAGDFRAGYLRYSNLTT